MKWYDEELWAWVTVALIAMFIMSHLSSCTTTKYVEVPVEIPKVETKYIVKNNTDSIHEIVYVKDSTNTWQRGDSIFKERYHSEIAKSSRNSNKTDTIFQTDTITKPLYITKNKEKAVEKELTWFQKLMLGSGKVVWICALLFALVWLAKRKL